MCVGGKCSFHSRVVKEVRGTREHSLASVAQDESELSPGLNLGLHRKADCGYKVRKYPRTLSWEVSDRIHKLNLCVRWDTEGLGTPLQLDRNLSPSKLYISLSSGPTGPFCNQFISHSWDYSLDTHPEVTDGKLQTPKPFTFGLKQFDIIQDH